eukprot:jgi/Psemu1/27214/gm1.27214_g
MPVTMKGHHKYDGENYDLNGNSDGQLSNNPASYKDHGHHNYAYQHILSPRHSHHGGSRSSLCTIRVPGNGNSNSNSNSGRNSGTSRFTTLGFESSNRNNSNSSNSYYPHSTPTAAALDPLFAPSERSTAEVRAVPSSLQYRNYLGLGRGAGAPRESARTTPYVAKSIYRPSTEPYVSTSSNTTTTAKQQQQQQQQHRSKKTNNSKYNDYRSSNSNKNKNKKDDYRNDVVAEQQRILDAIRAEQQQQQQQRKRLGGNNNNNDDTAKTCSTSSSSGSGRGGGGDRGRSNSNAKHNHNHKKKHENQEPGGGVGIVAHNTTLDVPVPTFKQQVKHDFVQRREFYSMQPDVLLLFYSGFKPEDQQQEQPVVAIVVVAFGLTASPMYRWLKFGRKLLLFCLPTNEEEETQQYYYIDVTIAAKYPPPALGPHRVWAACNGLKLHIQQQSGD